MARLPDPTSSLSPQARELYNRLTARRGRIDGMYRGLLNHPELTQHVSDLGSYLRFASGTLPDGPAGDDDPLAGATPGGGL